MSSSTSGRSGGSGAGKKLGCIGKCTSGLSPEELDLITDHVHRTLASTRGRAIFRRYLEQRSTDLACLDLYEEICKCVEQEQAYRLSARNPTLERLKANVDSILSALDDLEAVDEIDLALMERFSEAASSESRDAMLDCLDEIKNRLMNHLARAHKGFRNYVKQPCPKT